MASNQQLVPPPRPDLSQIIDCSQITDNFQKAGCHRHNINLRLAWMAGSPHFTHFMGDMTGSATDRMYLLGYAYGTYGRKTFEELNRMSFSDIVNALGTRKQEDDNILDGIRDDSAGFSNTYLISEGGRVGAIVNIVNYVSGVAALLHEGNPDVKSADLGPMLDSVNLAINTTSLNNEQKAQLSADLSGAAERLNKIQEVQRYIDSLDQSHDQTSWTDLLPQLVVDQLQLEKSTQDYNALKALLHSDDPDHDTLVASLHAFRDDLEKEHEAALVDSKAIIDHVKIVLEKQQHEIEQAKKRPRISVIVLVLLILVLVVSSLLVFTKTPLKSRRSPIKA